ncbi:hypothetical protein LI328DRAFT_137684 [Trichoderma asperelloides]|nr:hypothetical protein LI328DRAFT_137684 [Trichoderma asperelloides]
MIASLAYPILANYSSGKGGQINFYKDTKCSQYNGEAACWWNKTPFIGLQYEGGGPGDCFDLNMPGNSQSINIAGMWTSGGGADGGGCTFFSGYGCDGANQVWATYGSGSGTCLPARGSAGYLWKSAWCAAGL